MEGLEEFNRLIGQRIRELIPIQTTWAIVKSVDLEKKTMTATGLTDNLDYYDVLLGLGSEVRIPAENCKCLIGIIGNSANAFLIAADEIKEYLMTDKKGFKFHLKDGKLQMNGETYSGMVKAPELKKQVDKNTLVLQRIQEVFSNWQPVPEDGGLALKSLVSQFTNLERADLSNIENENIKHG